MRSRFWSTAAPLSPSEPVSRWEAAVAEMRRRQLGARQAALWHEERGNGDNATSAAVTGRMFGRAEQMLRVCCHSACQALLKSTQRHNRCKCMLIIYFQFGVGCFFSLANQRLVLMVLFKLAVNVLCLMFEVVGLNTKEAASGFCLILKARNPFLIFFYY